MSRARAGSKVPLRQSEACRYSLVTKTTSRWVTPGSPAKDPVTMSMSSSWLEAKQSTKRSWEPDTSETVPNAGSAHSLRTRASFSLGSEERLMNADQPALR